MTCSFSSEIRNSPRISQFLQRVINKSSGRLANSLPIEKIVKGTAYISWETFFLPLRSFFFGHRICTSWVKSLLFPPLPLVKNRRPQRPSFSPLWHAIKYLTAAEERRGESIRGSHPTRTFALSAGRLTPPFLFHFSPPPVIRNGDRGGRKIFLTFFIQSPFSFP